MFLFLLAQINGQAEFEPPPETGEVLLPYLLLSGLFSLFSLAYTAFGIWMLIHCFRHEPDRWFWMFLILFFWWLPGPLLYFFVRYLPSNQLRAPKFLRRWTRSRELSRLETAALQIGNPHQYVLWGDALRETGRLEQAAGAYAEALKKDPRDIQALWGTAQIQMRNQQHAAARETLAQVLEIDPQYKFGDVSMAYARTLYVLKDFEAAEKQLEDHVRRWRSPEAMYLLATIQASNGRPDEARDQLRRMLLDINSCPRGVARRYGVWKSKARRLLRRLPA